MPALRPSLILLALGLAPLGSLSLTACARDFPRAPAPDAGVRVGSGSACAGPDECLSGYCVDGYCCTSSCLASQVCNAPGAVGRCTDRPQGAPCDAGAACPSGACESGLCCDRACLPSEACDLPGSEGRCTPRPRGAACDAGAQCGTGACADGVCCDRACTGACESCALDGGVGTCLPAAENSDPRGRCGTCLACYGGLCAPALPGTDPNGACGAGRTCTATQTCAAAGGSRCASDRDCAAGGCVAGACLAVQAETVFGTGMAGNATLRNPEGLAADPAGRVSVLFTETTLTTPFDPFTSTASDVLEVALRVATRAPGGHWAVATVQRDTCNDQWGYTPSALLRLGAYAYVVTYSEVVSQHYTCGAPAAVPAGLYGALVAPSGAVAAYEVIDPSPTFLHQVGLAARDDGTLVAAYLDEDPRYEDGGTPLRVYERQARPDGGHGWAPLGIWSTDVTSFAFGQLRGSPVAVWTDRDGGYDGTTTFLRARRPEDAHATTARLATDDGQAFCCDQFSVVQAGIQAPTTGTALFTLLCGCYGGDRSYLLGRVEEAPDGGLALGLRRLPYPGELDWLTPVEPPEAPLVASVDYDDLGAAVSWAAADGGLASHPLVTAGTGRTMRPQLFGVSPNPPEVLFLVGRAATVTGASPDLELVRLAP